MIIRRTNDGNHYHMICFDTLMKDFISPEGDIILDNFKNKNVFPPLFKVDLILPEVG